MTDPTITLYTNFCSSTKDTRDNIPFYVYILSVSVKWIWGLKNMTEQCCIIKRVMAKDWKKPRQMLFFYIPESSDNSAAPFLWPGFVRTREIIVLVVLQVVFGDGTPSVIRTIKYFPLVVNQALINWAVAEQADFHNRLSRLSDTDNLRLCPVNPGHPKKQRQSRLSLKDLVNLLSISQT